MFPPPPPLPESPQQLEFAGHSRAASCSTATHSKPQHASPAAQHCSGGATPDDSAPSLSPPVGRDTPGAPSSRSLRRCEVSEAASVRVVSGVPYRMYCEPAVRKSWQLSVVVITVIVSPAVMASPPVDSSLITAMTCIYPWRAWMRSQSLVDVLHVADRERGQ